MKILFFGDSHLSAIKKGLEELDDTSDNFSFIARPQGKGGLRELKIANSGEIMAAGGDFFCSTPIKQLNINDYDVFCIIGIFPFTIKLANYSTGFLSSYANDFLSNDKNQFFALARQLRQFDKKIIFIHSPFPATNTKYPLHNHDEYLENIRLFNKKYLSPHNLLMLPQARETFELPLLKTKNEFLRSDKDFKHMNQQYGLAMVRELFGILQNQ